MNRWQTLAAGNRRASASPQEARNPSTGRRELGVAIVWRVGLRVEYSAWAGAPLTSHRRHSLWHARGFLLSASLLKIARALDRAGLELFYEGQDGKGAGVRLKKPENE